MDRLGVLVAVAAVTLVAVYAARRYAARRSAKVRALAPADVWTAVGAAPDGRPAVIRFSTPACGDCVVQDRVLAGLGVRVFPVDAARRHDVADRFGVLTAPTTVVLDPSGRVRAVNHGLAGAEVLRRQLEAVPSADRE